MPRECVSCGKPEPFETPVVDGQCMDCCLLARPKVRPSRAELLQTVPQASPARLGTFDVKDLMATAVCVLFSASSPLGVLLVLGGIAEPPFLLLVIAVSMLANAGLGLGLGHVVKGNAPLGAILGGLLGPIGLGVMAITADNRRHCKWGISVVDDRAKACPHCGREI